MLTFIGLGLYDLRDISVKGMEAVQSADLVYLEYYTSRLMGTSVHEIQEWYQKPIQILLREDVEVHPGDIIAAAKIQDVVFLTGGDPMVSTTHMDLRIRAMQAGVDTRIIHGASIASAVCGISGLQNYRFGKSCSLPFPAKNWFPTTPLEVITSNRERDLHTLVYLDIQDDRFMTVKEGLAILRTLAEREHYQIPLVIGIARAGSRESIVRAGTIPEVSNHFFGDPLHILVVPASLHPVEEEYLVCFAGYDPD
ncbi:MAG: diphthine synthase [Methanospirillaceae archaeon]|nr:diphthine synthase [Methanospirillaceae archaeon]